MKHKTSVTLSASLLRELDSVLGKAGNRSQLIERAVHEYLQKLARQTRDRRELEIINRNAAELNKEAQDVLTYQVKV